MNKDELVSIGKMSDLVNISTVTLRHYDKIDLFKPHYIDEETNYRYYKKEQIITLNMIKELKYRGFTLNDIKEFLKTSDLDKINDIYAKRRTEIDEEISNLIKQKHRLEIRMDIFTAVNQLKKSNYFLNSEVLIKRIDRRKIFYTGENINFNIYEVMKLYSKLHNLINDNNIDIFEPHMLIFEDNVKKIKYNDNIYVETAYNLGTDLVNNKNVKTLGQGDYATIYVKGSIIEASSNIKKLYKYISSNGYTVDGPLIAIYLVNYAHTKDPSEVIIEIQIKVKKK